MLPFLIISTDYKSECNIIFTHHFCAHPRIKMQKNKRNLFHNYNIIYEKSFSRCNRLIPRALCHALFRNIREFFSLYDCRWTLPVEFSTFAQRQCCELKESVKKRKIPAPKSQKRGTYIWEKKAYTAAGGRCKKWANEAQHIGHRVGQTAPRWSSGQRYASPLTYEAQSKGVEPCSSRGPCRRRLSSVVIHN